MIKKYSSVGANEIEIYFKKIAQELQPVDPAAYAEVEPSIVEGEGVDLGESAKQAVIAADKIGNTLGKIQENFPDEDSLAEAIGAANEHGSNIPGVAEAKTAREKRRILVKFARKVSSLKSNKARLELFKRAGIISESGLVKLGQRLEQKELIKYAQEEGSSDVGLGMLGGSARRFYEEGGVGRVADKLTGGADDIGAATTRAIERAGEVAGKAGTGIMGKIPESVSGLASKIPGVSTISGAVSKGLSYIPGASTIGGAVSKGVGYLGKGVSYLANVFRFLPAIFDFVRGLVALVKCGMAFGKVISVASQIKMSWWQPMINSDSLNFKVEEYSEVPSKLKIVGYVAGACKSFWQNIVETVLQGISGGINTMLGAFNVLSSVVPGGIIGSIIAGVGIGAAMEWIKGWLSSWAGGAASDGYVDVIKSIRALVASKVGDRAGAAAGAMMRSTPSRRRAI